MTKKILSQMWDFGGDALRFFTWQTAMDLSRLRTEFCVGQVIAWTESPEGLV
jgi:hypothetical protein